MVSYNVKLGRKLIHAKVVFKCKVFLKERPFTYYKLKCKEA